MDTPTPYRYEQLAELIVGMIDKGALAPGMRLPSVRAVSEQHRISISTALQAYRLLEDRGVLVARPQSGFYVAAARRGALALPSASRPRTKASTVSISGAVAALLEHASNSALVPLGCAVPDAALLQSKRLDLALARAARQHGTRYNTYCAPHGEPRLRREIAKRAMRVGHALSPDDVLVTCGCTEALTLALTAVAERGDTIAIESPTYFGVPAHHRNARPEGIRAADSPDARHRCRRGRAPARYGTRGGLFAVVELQQSTRLGDGRSRQTRAPRGARAACRTAHRRRRLRRHSLRSRAAETVHRARRRRQYDLLQLVFEIPCARLPDRAGLRRAPIRSK